MPYGLIFPVATVWLTYRLCQNPKASARLKICAAILAACSFVLPRFLGGYVGMSLQLGLCIAILLYTEARA
jgi:hypothetical protein